MTLASDSALDKALKIVSDKDSSFFVPKKLVSVKWMGSTVMAYPEIDISAPDAEKVFALRCNKAAGEAAYFKPSETIDFYSQRLGIDSHARVQKSQWFSRITNNWADPASLTVLGYYDNEGNRLNDAIDPATGILRDITDGSANTRRPEGVAIAKVELTVDYTDLHHAGDATTFKCSYFIPLPTGDITFINTTGNPVNRNTCNIVGDPFALDKADFKNQVLIPCNARGPAAIKAAGLGAATVTFDEAEMVKEINQKLMHVAAESIFHKLQEQFAPGFASTVHSTVEKITQSFKDGAGNDCTLTVLEYYSALQRGSVTFLDREVLPFNLAVHFANNLEPSIKEEFERKTKDHLTFSDLNRDAQLRQLDIYLKIANECEKTVNSTKNLVHRAMGDTHSFYSSLMKKCGIPLPQGIEKEDSSTFLSAAERTLQKYGGKLGEEQTKALRSIICWGCGGDHLWRDRQTKLIICPNKDLPGVAEKAAQMHKKYSDDLKKKKNQMVQRKKIKFTDLSAEQKEVARTHFLREAVAQVGSNNIANSVASSITTSTNNSAANAASRAPSGFSYPAVVILSANCTPAPILPVSIDNQLPHIVLALGTMEDSLETCPCIRVMFDSGASCSTGYLDFWLPILKAHPHVIEEMHTCENGQYHPIILGGIVAGDQGREYTTDLTVSVKIRLRYLTKSDQTISHTIALGRSVTVNTIIGNSFINSLHCVYDAALGIVDAKMLNAAPFKVIKCIPQRYSTADKVKTNQSGNYSATVKALEDIEKAIGDNATPSHVAPWTYHPKPFGPTASPKSFTSSGAASVTSSGSDSDSERRSCAIWGKAKKPDGISIDKPTKRLRFKDDLDVASPLQDDWELFDLHTSPIRVERTRKGKRKPNVYLDDRGFPDQQVDWDWVQEENFGRILSKRRRKHDMRDSIDPDFNVPYDEAKHGDYLREALKLDHLTPAQQAELTAIVKEYWGVFNPEGMSTPVLDYECNIDTGTASPIRTKRCNYGPRESKIMQPMIDKLEAIGQIYQIFDGEWLSQALLAPKPHQENIFAIANYIWRLCINYIALNQVTKVISYPIPRCDFAVLISLGAGKFRWLFDAPQGFHQIAVNKASQEKLAFAGPFTRKYTYRVMPFGVVNGPVTFVVFIYDCKADWDDLARQRDINVGDGTNSVIIIDDIHGVSSDWKSAMAYFRCQLDVCLRRRLSLNLKKCHLFDKRFEFVGHDVTADGTHPAQSKFDLVRNWPKPIIIRDVASLIGFAQFYSIYIPFMEVKIPTLRALCSTNDYNSTISPDQWTDQCQGEFDFLKTSILNDPCCAQYDWKKRFYLKTDFANVGMGYVGCQPDDDPTSIAAMRREMEGGGCEFLTNAKTIGDPPRLRPICMGSRRNRGYETRLHSHLGEAFTLKYAIDANRLYCWGARFTAINDCWSLKFVMTYEGNNAVILRVQMQLMLWAMDIVHRTRDFNVDSDYMSKIAVDSRFDPLLAQYLLTAAEMRSKYPAPTGVMKPENMPNYRPKRGSPKTESDAPAIEFLPGVTIDGQPVDAQTQHVVALTNAVEHNRQLHMDSFSIYPIRYHTQHDRAIRNFVTTRLQSKIKRRTANDPIENLPLQNGDVSSVTRQLTTYQAIIYGFGGGHLYQNLLDQAYPIQVVAAADLDSDARALMQDMMRIPRIFSTAQRLFDWITSNDDIYVDLYLCHAPMIVEQRFLSCWWRFQSQIITKARIAKGLQVFVIYIPSLFHVEEVSDKFQIALKRDGWTLHISDIDFPTFGDSIDDRCSVIMGVHRSTQANVAPLLVVTPPSSPPKAISDFVFDKFNESCYAVSFSRKYIDQHPTGNLKIVDSMPTPPPRSSRHSRRLYDLVPSVDIVHTTLGTGVYDTNYLLPPLSKVNDSIFGQLFGIEFDTLETTLVRPISPYEMVRGFGFPDTAAQKLALRSNLHLLTGAIPILSSRAILNTVLDRLRQIRDESVNVDETTPFAAPAATAQILFTGATGHTLPDTATWVAAYENDPDTRMIKAMIANPGLINRENLNKIHYVYRHYARGNQFSIDKSGMLFIHEALAGSDDIAQLQVVPASLQNIVFIAFHANPVGGHFNAWRTFHRIRLRFFWPGMYKYIDNLVKQCAGCRLSNPGVKRSAELVYHFPVTQPLSVVHIDAYTAGALKTYDGVSCYVVGACNMTTFGMMEGVQTANATTFASALMKMQLRYGFFHVLVLDKDSKFYSTFRETAALLKIQTHTLSGGNHDPMIVERLCRYFNKTLKIFCNEHGQDPCVSHEGLAMSLYAWNCGPIPGTDISRCLAVTGRDWEFPIAFSKDKHLELISSPKNINNFAQRQAQLILSASREIARILVDEHRALHREKINSLRPDPFIYDVGDYVLARRVVQSSKKHNRVGKLEFAYTGPWIILRKLQGSSYECRHTTSNKISKFHAAHLSPMPREMLPFAPVDGPDHRFGQINKPLDNEAYKLAGIEGFLPKQPWKAFAPEPFDDSHIPQATSSPTADATSQLIQFDDDEPHFPSLWELNNEMDNWDTIDLDTWVDDRAPVDNSITPTFALSPVPTAQKLASALVASASRLFFISWSRPTSSRREWHLVQVQFESSVSLNPDCLHNGKYLVNFLICHPKDRDIHPKNQRWWLEYHAASSVARLHEGDYHLIRPDQYASIYAKNNRLHPFCQWVNLLHPATFIHGPFEFATINNRLTRDRISVDDWTQLTIASSKYDDAAPDLDVRDWSGIQYSRNYHTTIMDPDVHARVLATNFIEPEIYSFMSIADL